MINEAISYLNITFAESTYYHSFLNSFTALSSLSRDNSPDCLHNCSPFLNNIKVGVLSIV